VRCLNKHWTIKIRRYGRFIPHSPD